MNMRVAGDHAGKVAFLEAVAAHYVGQPVRVRFSDLPRGTRGRAAVDGRGAEVVIDRNTPAGDLGPVFFRQLGAIALGHLGALTESNAGSVRFGTFREVLPEPAGSVTESAADRGRAAGDWAKAAATDFRRRMGRPFLAVLERIDS